ncbi:MAG: RloB family protein [Cyanobacteria bacterium J06597_1]
MASKTRRSRGYRPRRTGTREVRKRFLIVCEGKKTEPIYFKSFPVPTQVVTIDVHGLGRNPNTIVDEANQLSRNSEYDQVWCVFDRDSFSLQDFNSAIQKAEGHGFKVAYTNESFELWYLLHFHFLDSGISRTSYKEKLSTLIGRTYDKCCSDMYDILIEKQKDAIQNAYRLLENYSSANPGRDNPSTTVHLLVEELNQHIQ